MVETILGEAPEVLPEWECFDLRISLGGTVIRWEAFCREIPGGHQFVLRETEAPDATGTGSDP